MKQETLAHMAMVQLVNWIGVPILGIVIWAKLGFGSAFGFFIAWLILDKILMSLGLGAIDLYGEHIKRSPGIAMSFVEGEVSLGFTMTYLLGIIATLILPYILGIGLLMLNA